MNMQLHKILGVSESTLPDHYTVMVDMTDSFGIRETLNYALNPDDNNGLAPAIRQAVEDWIASGNTPDPYVEPPAPTHEALRASMPPLTARQLRLGLIGNGITLASVQAAVDGIADPTAREMAQVEWEYATTFERTHSLISQIGTALNLTPEEIDTMWSASISL